MGQRNIIHFVDADTRVRAELASTVFTMGHHAEVYADLDELCDHPPRSGIIVARDRSGVESIEGVMERLAETGIWLPLVAMDANPRTSRVVAAIKAGALDYLPLPLDSTRLAEMLDHIGSEALEQAEARRRMVEARGRIGNLSAREREVLDRLAVGNSNKSIARDLQISPRTVEIHRANMMSKLGANHSAEAVRLQIEARLERFAGRG